MLGATTGVWMRFESVAGDLFQYRIRLEGVSLTLSKHLRCSAESCVIECSLRDANLETLVIAQVILTGARFEYTHVSHEDVIPRDLPPFVIKHLVLHDSEVIFTDQTRGIPLTFSIRLAEYHCSQLHSRSLLFDALFTATATGQLEKSPLTTRYQRSDTTCQAQWAIRDLPVRRVSRFVKGQLALLEQSTLDLLITPSWHVAEDALTLHVQVWIRDLVPVNPSPLLPAPSQRFNEALNQLLNPHLQSVPITFQLSVSRQDFLKLTRLDAFQILLAFSEALSQAILARSRQNYDQLVDMGRFGLNALLDLKQIFDKY